MARRHEKNEQLIYGINPVYELLRAGRRNVRSLLVVNKPGKSRIDGIVRLASSKAIPVRWIDGSEMAKRFPGREDQGIAALAEPFKYHGLDEILHGRPSPCLLLALDEIQDPQNIGAIVRSAAAFDCSGLIMHRDRSTRITPAAVKASAGMTEHVHIAAAANLASAIKRVKNEGIWVLGLDAEAHQSIYNEDLTLDIMLVLGSEGKGLRRLTSELCDTLVSIPLSDLCESLNVSTAAAVVLAEATRQRSKKSRGE